MKLLAKTFPVLLFQLGQAQTDHPSKKIEFGFSTSTFAGSSINYITDHFLEKENVYSYVSFNKPSVTFANFGWKQGAFIWVNVTKCISYKPQFDILFGVNQYKYSDRQTIYSKFFGVEFKPQIIIRVGCCDKDPIIKMARNMSYYLSQRQTYLIFGPKWSFKRSDKYFLKHNTERNYFIGGVFGFGVDNLFPNLDVAPEVLLSFEYQTGNRSEKEKGSNRVYTSLSLSMNLF